MIRPISLVDAAAFLAGELIINDGASDQCFDAVSTDTRAVNSGELFVALRGEAFDAHDFLSVAERAGALALVVERHVVEVGIPQIVVADTTVALGQLGLMVRGMFSGPLVALTGSCGKTSVKEMLASVLSQTAQVHATQGNFNNHIGVPLTLLDLSAGDERAVIEMGASGPGEIDYLAALAKPAVALVNNVMAAHLEGFGLEADVAFEKSRIFFRLAEAGVAIVNLDEPYAQGWLNELAEARPDVRVLTYARANTQADIYAEAEVLAESGCYQFDLIYQNRRSRVKLRLAGQQSISNALAVAACAQALNLPIDEIKAGLELVQPVKGRVEPKLGLAGSLVIDDSYNANPGSVRAAAALLADMQAQAETETWLVLGDLGELGANKEIELELLGRDIAAAGIKNLLTVGSNSAQIERGFSAAKGTRGLHMQEQVQAIEYIKQQLKENVAVLVKGSRSARMEVVVNAITDTAIKGDE